jgi:hypothetical protein
MECPACGSSRVLHSRAKSLRDRILKRLLPVTFYRCHDCNWRSFRFIRTLQGVLAYALSVIGYGATIGMAIAILIGIILLAMTLLGVPTPW